MSRGRNKKYDRYPSLIRKKNLARKLSEQLGLCIIIAILAHLDDVADARAGAAGPSGPIPMPIPVVPAHRLFPHARERSKKKKERRRRTRGMRKERDETKKDEEERNE